MRKNGTSWLTKLVVLLLAISNAGPATAAAALSTKACDLLTVKDVEGVLGAGYTQQEGLNNQIMSTCAYSKGQANLVGITLKQELYGAPRVLQMEQEGIKQQGKKITPVSGLGEGAYYFQDSETNAFQLRFGKGNLGVILTADSNGKPNIDAAMRLAKIAYSRLK